MQQSSDHQQKKTTAQDTKSRLAPKSQFLLLSLVAVVAMAFGASLLLKPDVQKPFRLGMSSWIGNDLLLLAQEKGYFKGHHIQLTIFPSAEEVIRAFQNGSIDAASVTGDEVLRLVATKQNPRIFQVLDFSNGSDAIVARPPIKTLNDLRGKRIAVESNAVGAFILARALEKMGVPQSDVTIVPQQLNEHIRSYSENTVDAVVSYEPMLSQLKALGAVQVFTSREIPFEIFDVLVTREATLREQPDNIKAIRNAWARARRNLREQPQESIQLIASYYRAEPSAIEGSLKGIILPDEIEIPRLLAGQDALIGQGLKRLARVMAQFGLLTDEVDTSEVVPDE